MSYIPVIDTVLNEMVMALASQIVEMTFNWATSTPIDTTFLTNLATVFGSVMQSSFLPILSQRLTDQAVRSTDLTSSAAPSVVVAHTGHSGGVAEATGQPGNVTIAVKNNTLSRGRSFRGRQYVPGIPLSALVSGNPDEITPTFVAALLSAYADIATNVGAVDTNGQSVVVSKHANKAPRVIGVTTPIVSYTVNTAIDSQRRRLAGRGT